MREYGVYYPPQGQYWDRVRDDATCRVTQRNRGTILVLEAIESLQGCTTGAHPPQRDTEGVAISTNPEWWDEWLRGAGNAPLEFY